MAFGEILKQARLDRNWTREYIAERTHMMTSTIEALETENFKKIPAPIYGRGFIRNYCLILGISPQPLIDEYMSAVDKTYVRSTVTRPEIHDTPFTPEPPIRTGRRTVMPPPKEDEPISYKSSYRLVSSGGEPLKAIRPADTPAMVEQPRIATTAPSPAPKPVAMPKPEAPAPRPIVKPKEEAAMPLPADDLFAYAEAPSEVMPPPPAPQVTPSPEPIRQQHRLVKTVKPQEPAPMPVSTATTGSIFGPQHPVEKPTHPTLKLIQKIGSDIKAKITGIGTKPKVHRAKKSQGIPLVTRRNMIQGLTIFGVLMLLSLMFLLFRWVFQESSSNIAQPVEATLPTFAPSVVISTPEPYFK